MEARDLGTRIAACKREIRTRSTDGVERRFHRTTVEERAKGDGWQIVGLGIVYNSLSENLGGFREEVAPGAAEGLLDDPDIAGLFNHNPDLLLGRVGAGTMRLSDSDKGVVYDIDGSNRSYALDLRESLRLKEVTRSSFAFRVARGGDEWEEDEESGLLVRTITKFSRLFDMSPVTYAAYPETDAGTRDASLPINDGDRVAESHDDLTLGKLGTVVKTYADPDDGAVIHDVEWDDGSISEGLRGWDLRRLDVPPIDRERNDGDEAARQRPADGPDDDEQVVDERPNLKAVRERARLRVGEPPLT